MPLKRKTAITLARIAGYHDDAKTFTRIRVEARVSYHILAQAWSEGRKAKNLGVRCTCGECNPKE